jgi:hypothetical protein
MTRSSAAYTLFLLAIQPSHQPHRDDVEKAQGLLKKAAARTCEPSDAVIAEGLDLITPDHIAGRVRMAASRKDSTVSRYEARPAQGGDSGAPSTSMTASIT